MQRKVPRDPSPVVTALGALAFTTLGNVLSHAPWPTQFILYMLLVAGVILAIGDWLHR